VLDYSSVSDRGHVECAPLIFTAVESHLSERQASPQLLHDTFRENSCCYGNSRFHGMMSQLTGEVIARASQCWTPEANLLKAKKH